MNDKPKILLIEDDEIDQKTVVRSLGDGFSVEIAENEAEALKLVEKGGFHCAILDFELPNTDTKDLLDAIVAAGLPVLMLSGYDDRHIAVQAMKYGASDFLSKDEFSKEGLLRAIEGAVERGNQASGPKEHSFGNQLKFLLVDDDEIDILSVKRGFSKVNIANPIYTASNGREALDILKGENGKQKLTKPYIVLLDLDMPIMNGLEFLDELRRVSYLKDTIVFMLTSSDHYDDKAQAYETGISGYLIKSQVGEDFLEKIRMIKQFIVSVELPGV